MTRCIILISKQALEWTNDPKSKDYKKTKNYLVKRIVTVHIKKRLNQTLTSTFQKVINI